jgi:hypothetical protein
LPCDELGGDHLRSGHGVNVGPSGRRHGLSVRWSGLLTTVAAAALAAGGPLSAAGDFPGSVVLGRPTDHSVTVNALADGAMEMYVEYGPAGATPDRRTRTETLPAGSPFEVVLDGLAADQDFQYRLRYRAPGAPAFEAGAAHGFHTQRASGAAFTFDIQADSHLDEQSDVELYRQALGNIAADRPDFLIDLGDTFMSEKFATKEADVIGRHLLQRPLLGAAAGSAPLFLVLGNHEGEWGEALNGTGDNLAVWATRARQRYYPNPVPDAFYGGDTEDQPFVGRREAYYAWAWGDALFVVLDPYWNTTVKPQRAKSNWAWTLGERQYRWLVDTLEASRARYKLVFCHNLVGGVSLQGRGGIEGAPYYEWGGRNADGTWGFDAQRPGWVRPIHQVLVDTGVNAVFHGHDHLFVRQELDGIVYQEVPQPSHPRGTTGQATDPEWGYTHGVVLGSSGHLRVRVSPEAIAVEYVRAFRSDDPANGAQNGRVDYRYEIPSGAPPGVTPAPPPTVSEPPTPTATAAAGTPTASPVPPVRTATTAPPSPTVATRTPAPPTSRPPDGEGRRIVLPFAVAGTLGGGRR